MRMQASMETGDSNIPTQYLKRSSRSTADVYMQLIRHSRIGLACLLRSNLEFGMQDGRVFGH